MLLRNVTHIGGFLVVVNLVDSSGQAKVSNLHHIVLGHQNIPGCQISVDALQRETKGMKNSQHELLSLQIK